MHTLINFEVNIRKYKPDVLIVMHGINDLLHNVDFSYFSHGEFREDKGHFYGPVNRLIAHKPLTVSSISIIISLRYHIERKIVEQDKYPGELPFCRNLNTLIDFAEQDGLLIVLMTHPSLYSDHKDETTKSHLYMLRNEAIGPTKKWSYCTAKMVLKGIIQL